MLPFALRGRWLVGHLVVLALAALFVRLGMWQLDRLEEVRQRNAAIRSKRAMPVAELSALIGPGDGPEEAVYRRLRAEGTYDRRHELVVPFRSLEGERGRYVLTPLLTEGDRALVVNRGWVPEGGAARPEPPPAGTVTVAGLALPFEAGGRSGPRTGEGPVEVTRIDATQIGRLLPYDLAPVYLQLETQRPGVSSTFPRPLPPPTLSEGSHLSYAVQWFVFAGIGVTGWPVLLYREGRQHARRRAPEPA